MDYPRAGIEPARKPTLFPRHRGIDKICSNMPFEVEDLNGLREFAERATRAASAWQRRRLIGQAKLNHTSNRGLR